MSIPESQLITWSGQGAVVSSSKTYASIKYALEQDSKSKVKDKKMDIFLQGSYGNTTNIYGNSDVDVVVKYEYTYDYDITKLSQPEVQNFNAVFSPATYLWEHFHSDVVSTLQTYYGSSKVDLSGKVPKVNVQDGLPQADVVVAIDYRNYSSFLDHSRNQKVPGIRFHIPNENSRPVVNYPKPHLENGTKKHQATNEWYKPTVRIFKNMRDKLIGNGAIQKNTAPSYFLECLIYNVPDGSFGQSYQLTVLNTLNFLHKADLTKFVCQNYQLYLFGSAQEQWNEDDAKLFINHAINLWNKWA